MDRNNDAVCTFLVEAGCLQPKPTVSLICWANLTAKQLTSSTNSKTVHLDQAQRAIVMNLSASDCTFYLSRISRESPSVLSGNALNLTYVTRRSTDYLQLYYIIAQRAFEHVVKFVPRHSLRSSKKNQNPSNLPQ